MSSTTFVVFQVVRDKFLSIIVTGVRVGLGTSLLFNHGVKSLLNHGIKSLLNPGVNLLLNMTEVFANLFLKFGVVMSGILFHDVKNSLYNK